MSDLVVVVYPSEARAEEMRAKILDLQKQYLIELDNVVIAEKKPNGKIKLHQEVSATGYGAVSGGLWGMLIGLIFFMPITGAVIGAASGAMAGALSDYGINDEFKQQLQTSLQPGNAALFVLIHKVTADKVLEALRGSGGMLVKTSLDHSKESALRAALAGAQAEQASQTDIATLPHA